MAFDGNAPFAFQVHIIQHLRLKVFPGYCSGVLQQTICQCAFPVVDVCNDTEVAYIFHLFIFKLNSGIKIEKKAKSGKWEG